MINTNILFLSLTKCLLINVVAPSNYERNKYCPNEIGSFLLLEGVHIFYQQYNTGQNPLLFQPRIHCVEHYNIQQF